MGDDIDPNAHVRAFLEYYVDAKDALGYAVMLTGPWGVGKTFLIRRFFEQRGGNGPTHLYVSLYGVASADEFKQALFASAYPLLGGRGAKVLGSIARSALAFKGVGTDLKLHKLKSISADKVIIVDDLERCAMPIQQALGLLNSLVEHDGHKLIILGNEEEIPEDQIGVYRNRREKLIGQILAVKSDVPGAYLYFMKQLRTTPARAFLTAKREQVLAVYSQSAIENLRVLQQSLWQFERIHEALPEEYRKNQKGVLAVLELFLALSLEYRSGALTGDQIAGRETGMLLAVARINRRQEADPFTAVDNKYVGLDLRDELLSNRTLSQILLDGHIDVQNIVADLEKSDLFGEVVAEEAWRTVWWESSATKLISMLLG
jgi:hypothetical protein